MHHLTIDELIHELDRFSENEILYTASGHVLNGKLHSYRGDYSELSLGYCENDDYLNSSKVTVGQMIQSLEDIIGNTLYGHKGGEFIMKENTICWLSGNKDWTELKVVGVEEIDGLVYLMTAMDV